MRTDLRTPSPRLARTLAVRAAVLRIAADVGVRVHVERIDALDDGRIVVAVGAGADDDASVATALADLVATDAGLTLDGPPTDFPPLLAPRGWSSTMRP